jgi:hypothetical protein
LIYHIICTGQLLITIIQQVSFKVNSLNSLIKFIKVIPLVRQGLKPVPQNSNGGRGSAVSIPQNNRSLPSDITITRLIVGGHGSAVSLPQNHRSSPRKM